MENTFTNTHPRKDRDANMHTQTLPSLYAYCVQKHSLFYCNAYIHVRNPDLCLGMHTYIKYCTTQGNWEIRMYEMAVDLICCGCLSRQRMTTQQRYDVTRNSQINKLRGEGEEKMERGRQQSLNNKLRGGESLGNIKQSPGNSRITCVLNSSSTGSISTGELS